MQKSPDLRYQTAGELLDDLKRLKSTIASLFRRRTVLLTAAAIILVSAPIGYLIHTKPRKAPTPVEPDTVVIADFNNVTGETIFDAPLRQALRVQLEQSPFLSLVSDAKAHQELAYMGRPPDTKLIGLTAREACLRLGGKVAVEGSISTLGRQYVIGLQALNCQTGEAVVNEQTGADGREAILHALDGLATKLRTRLGESLSSIQRFSTPIEQATTTSLDALYAYSMGKAVGDTEGAKSTVPFAKRAIELDPNFAMAHVELGVSYFNFLQPSLGAEELRKAYELRERVSEHEKLEIEALYYTLATGETDKAIQAYRLWKGIYPHERSPYINLGGIYQEIGQQELAVDQEREALRIGIHGFAVYSHLACAYIDLNQFDEAEQVLDEAKAKKEENPLFIGLRYQLGFLRGNHDEMRRQVGAAAGKPGLESWLLALQADTAAYHGYFKRSQGLAQRAVNSARHDGDEETAQLFAATEALREAELGKLQLTTEHITAISRGRGQQVQAIGALALARAGESEKSLALVRDLNQRFPLDTLLNEYWLPTIRAAIQLHRHNPAQAVEILEQTKRYEMAGPQTAVNVVLYPIYLRGEAYLALGQPVNAEKEFQKILDHPGLIINYVLGASAHLELGRAYAMEAGVPVSPTIQQSAKKTGLNQAPMPPDALAKAHAAYQDFFAIWKDADPDISLLKQARMEYRKLQ
jgi:predicted Zn-dependent protease